jgi:hypothetical protein
MHSTKYPGVVGFFGNYALQGVRRLKVNFSI